MKKTTRLAPACLVALLMLGVWSCESRLERREGNVLMTISDFDGLPSRVSVNAPEGVTCSRFSRGGCVLTIGQVDVRSIVTNAAVTASELMTIEIRSYEVVFNRRAPGSRQPPPFVASIFGNLAPGGTTTFENLPIMGEQQFLNLPLSDLLIENGGLDTETTPPGATIVIDAQLRFFGRTISGNNVSTEVPASFTLVFGL